MSASNETSVAGSAGLGLIKYHVRVGAVYICVRGTYIPTAPRGTVDSQMGVASHKLSRSSQCSNQIDKNPYVVHIIRLASSSSTKCEGDLASGKSRRALPMAPPTILT